MVGTNSVVGRKRRGLEAMSSLIGFGGLPPIGRPLLLMPAAATALLQPLDPMAASVGVFADLRDSFALTTQLRRFSRRVLLHMVAESVQPSRDLGDTG